MEQTDADMTGAPVPLRYGGPQNILGSARLSRAAGVHGGDFAVDHADDVVRLAGFEVLGTEPDRLERAESPFCQADIYGWNTEHAGRLIFRS